MADQTTPQMTEGQYRALVAYLNFWTPQYPQMDLNTAIRDIGITEDRKSVIWHLSSCLWEFNEETGLINYNDRPATPPWIAKV